MALPGTFSPTEPQAGETVASGPAKLQANFQALADFLGIPSAPTLLTSGAFSITAGGVVTLSQSGSSVIADPTSALGIATKQYVDAASPPPQVTTGGTTAYNATCSANILTLAGLTGRLLVLQMNVTNTVAAASPFVTLTVTPTGGTAFAATGIKKWVNSSLVDLGSGDLPANAIVVLSFDGTVFELISVANQVALAQGSSVSNLRANAIPAATSFVSFTADRIVTINPTTSAPTVLTAFSDTSLNIGSATGPSANGWDYTGAVGATQVCHIYAISGPAVTAALIASQTAPPTGPVLPTGYTSFAYLITVVLSASALQNIYIAGNTVYYPRAPQPLVNGTAFGPISTAPNVPTIALLTRLQIQSISTSATQSLVKFALVSTASFPITLTATGSAAHTDSDDMEWTIPNISQFAYDGSGGTANAWILSYTCPNNGD